MKVGFGACFTILVLFATCSKRNDGEGTSGNLLTTSLSPYLREHGDNPVHWREWNDETIELARKQNKPLLVSIGYAACHWCHVMEEESFMDTVIANVMNKNFVCVKVDREERPDVDNVFIAAAELINGNAGWPLNAFALPDGKPFFATTYLPKDRWKQLVQQIAITFNNQNEDVVRQASALTEAIKKGWRITDTGNSKLEKGFVADYAKKLIASFDVTDGGLKGAPKFPLPLNLEFLLQFHSITGNVESLSAATLTLDKMAMGGIYDHVGGGFARYSTDAKWKVPHFEKMLYDNAQLLSVYSHAYQITKKTIYARVIRETADFVVRELTSADGGFYSSINADSEGEEGKFYVWTKNELTQTVTAPAFFDFFNIVDSGNWEAGKNILFQTQSLEQFANRQSMPISQAKQIVDESLKKLNAARTKRVRPTTDKKVIASWNALMVMGLLDASNALQDSGYRNIAIKAGRFLTAKLVRSAGGMSRNFHEGRSSVDGFLDDYALASLAFIRLYECTFDIEWLNQSKRLVDFATTHFTDSSSSLMYYTPDNATAIVTRKKESTDQVLPSSNAVMAQALLTLGEMYQDDKLAQRSRDMIHEVTGQMESDIFSSHWAAVATMSIYKPIEVAVVGADAVAIAHELQSKYLPLAIYLGGNTENLPLLENKKISGQTTIFVCKDRVCKLPVINVKDGLAQIVKMD